MKLILIRHAKAQERRKSDSIKDDFHRKLTRSGVRRAKALVHVIQQLSGPIDLLITSPLRRAVDTAKLFYSQDWKSAQWIELESLAPESDPKLIVHWLSKQPLLKMKSSATVALVGHEPHLGRLAGLLTVGKSISLIELKKCAVGVLEFEKQMGIGKGRLTGLFQPVDLQRMEKD